MSQSNEPFDPYYQWLGIPPDEQPANHYRLLGIQLFEANREVIQHAGDRQMAHLRSFQNGPRASQSQRLLNEVAAAKLCLLSPDRKAAYDADLATSGSDVAVPPPIGPDLPCAPSAGIAFGGAAGTLSADPAFRAARISRSRRRPSSWVPWLLGLITAVVATLAAWSWWRDRLPSEQLILEWPAAMREEATLLINGQSLDLIQDPVAGDAQELTFALPPGSYHVQITRPGFEAIGQSVEVAGGTPTRMEIAFVAVATSAPDAKSKHPPLAVGRIILRWPLATRTGASLEIDGHAVDLTRRAFMDNPETVETAIKAGAHALHVALPDGQVLDRSFTVEAGERWELTVTTTPVRLVLRWPEVDRADARLELNGRLRDLAADSVAVDAEHVVFEVQPGQHTVRIARPGFEDFRTELADLQAEQQIDVTWVVAPHVRPAQAELQKLRGEYKKQYEKFEQYEKWAAEKDAAKQGELLRYLLARLESEAASLPAQSAELWAACDEMLDLALTGGQFVLAQNLLTGTAGSELFSDTERQTWEDRIWDAAMKSTRVDDLADYLRLRKTAGRLPTEQEQAVIVQRLSEAARAGVDHTALATRIEELLDQSILGQAVATQAQVAVYVQAAGKEFATPAETLDLCERILTIIPFVFESGHDDVARQVDSLGDALADALRRKALKEARALDELRMRIWRIEEGIKVVRDWASQFPRVQEARKRIADGQATPTEHKLVAFWLLQLGHYSAALPHLCNAEDESLVHFGQTLPDTAKGLATLADEVELEAKKTKYSRRQEDALRGFARYLRQQALDKNDTSLQPAERVELQKKLSAAEPRRTEIDNRRFPKEQWCSLTDVVSADELRDRIEHAGGGDWSLLQDGSIATNGKGTTRLELPVPLPRSYGIRFACRRISGSDVNVHLPLGETSVVLTLGGSSSRYSGLQLVEGRDITDALNPTRIPRADATFVGNAPLAVEIQVDVAGVESQSAKERKQTEGREWATLKVVLGNARKAPVIRRVSLATAAFTPPKDMDLSSTVLGLSTHAEAVYINLQLIRH